MVPVLRGAETFVLKVAWPPGSTTLEELALRTWDGRGAARLVEADPEHGVLLLERLDPTYSLAALPVLTAAHEAGLLVADLSVPAPVGVPRLADMADEMRASIESRRSLLTGRDIRWVDLAVSLFHSLSDDTDTTVHGDLHYENILRGQRSPWLAIDPKPVAGAPERAVAELLVTRVDDLADDNEVRELLSVIVQAACMDRDKAAMWALARTVDYWLWGLEQGLTVDPPRCRRVVEALEPLLP